MTAIVSRETRAQLDRLAAEHRLPDGAEERLAQLLAAVAAEPSAITTVRDPAAAVDAHVADSLDGLRVSAVRETTTLADLGSGGGFPGLVLAVARPDAHVALVESVGKKAAFLRATAEELGLENVEVVTARAEAWRDGAEAQDVVTARALARLAVLAEYAAPLLRVGGALVAWKGRRSPSEEADGAAAAEVLGLAVEDIIRTPSRPGADERYLHVLRKVAPTPAGYPRREGMARKRPLGLSRLR